MQLDGETNGLDLNTLIDFLSDSDDTNFPVARKVHLLNAALEEVVGKIINADGTWQYDDTNFTDLPVGTGTLVEGQEAYSFSSDYLQIEAIEIKNADGLFERISPLDHQELGGVSPQEYFGIDSSGNAEKGFPRYFDQMGDTIRLYPAPTSTDVTLSGGIKVYFKRKPDLFTTSDTTQEPGIPSPYHSMLAYMAAIPYCVKFHKDRVPLYQKKVDEMMENLIEHFAHREKTKRAKILTKRKSFR